MKMGIKKIPTDDIHPFDIEFKKPKTTLEEDVIVVIEDVEEVEGVEEVGEELSVHGSNLSLCH